MSYIVTNTKEKEETLINDNELYDYFYDNLEPEDFIKWMNEVFGYTNLPIVGNVPAGNLIHRLIETRSDYDEIFSDWINEIVDNITEILNDTELLNDIEIVHCGDYEIKLNKLIN